MLCVNVELQERRYPILIGNGLLQDERSYPVKLGGSRDDCDESHGCTVLLRYGNILRLKKTRVRSRSCSFARW